MLIEWASNQIFEHQIKEKRISEKRRPLCLFLQDSSNPLLQEVWRNIKEEDLSPTATAGMERVREDEYAFMLWELFFDMNYGHDCRVFMLPARYFSTYTSFAFPRDSPLVPLMNKLYGAPCLLMFWCLSKIMMIITVIYHYSYHYCYLIYHFNTIKTNLHSH